jgi:hypothetical protein
MRPIRIGRPALGTVLGLLALIIAVGGSTEAFSAKKTVVIVRKGQIAKGAVTAKALAPGAVHAGALSSGAVHPGALAPGAVTAPALGGGAVGSGSIAPDAVTSAAIAPGSVYGGALGAVTVHGAPIADTDSVAHNGEWTSSTIVTALCAVGERVISGGVVFTDSGDRQAAIIQSVPFVNGNGQGWVGQITTDSGGSAMAEAQALCLK